MIDFCTWKHHMDKEGLDCPQDREAKAFELFTRAHA